MANELDGEELATPENFDEYRYLVANPDVAVLVESGAAVSGWIHFQAYGRTEGRKLAPADVIRTGRFSELEPATVDNFDEYRYLVANPDIATQVRNGAAPSGWAHFQLYGRTEGRKLAARVGPIGVASAFFESRPPAPQNSLDLFHGTWSSYIPGFGYGKLGNPFASDTITWLIGNAGDLTGRSVLELGPLEAGHTYALCNAGAKVTAIESNAGAYLKCLVIKELFNLPARFLFGDFNAFLQNTPQRYDWVLASGVLYHTQEPVDLLEHIARTTDNLMLWTMYYDAEVVQANADLRARFDSEPVHATFRGTDIEMHRYNYLDALEWAGFSGGPGKSGLWLTRDSILAILDALGYKVTLGQDDAGPGGSSLTLIARR